MTEYRYRVVSPDDNPGVEFYDASDGKAIGHRPATIEEVKMWRELRRLKSIEEARERSEEALIHLQVEYGRMQERAEAAEKLLEEKAEEVATFIQQKGAEFNAAVIRLDATENMLETALANAVAIGKFAPENRAGALAGYVANDITHGVGHPSGSPFIDERIERSQEVNGG